MAAASAPPVEDVLAWEAEHRPRAGAAALLAGFLTILGTVISAITLRDKPSVTLFEALRDAAGKPPPDGGLKTSTVLFVHHHAVALTLGQVLSAFGGLLAAGALVYLFLAARARNPNLNQLALGAAAVGGIAFFVGTIVPQVAVDISAAHFASSADHSTIAAHHALQPGAALVGALIGYIGTLALGISFVIVSLNAMRVGLLTRFMGILGVVSGVLFVIPLASLPVIQAFWLGALGMLILGRWPNGVPPAWQTGRAEPWPSRQQLLEARDEGKPGPAESESAPQDGAAEPAHPARPRSKKKKRRR
jgi:hypothetical protein